MRKTGIAVKVNSKEEFEKVKSFLTEDVLYFDWHENMLIQQTAVILKANKNSSLSSGSIGGAKFYESMGIEVLPFKENLIEYLL